MINKIQITQNFIKIFILSFLFFTNLFNQEKLKFSANILENKIEKDIETQIFKDNVIINKNTMKLYTDKAIYYPDLNQVILIDNVRMYDIQDSLFCDSLILYDTDYKFFEAINDVNFFQQTNTIKCQRLIFEEKIKNKTIQLYDNAKLIDSLRVVKGDSIYIDYKDSVINNIKISDNSEIINYRYAKIDSISKIQRTSDYISSKKMFIQFKESLVDSIHLQGMAITKFNAVKDTILQGLNHVEGDSIIIKFDNDIIDRMQVRGGATGKFIPEKHNADIDSTIIFQAQYIDYQIDEEKSYLYDDAYVKYDFTELNSGYISVDWKTNSLQAFEKNNQYPSINSFGDTPTYGEQMNFDLKSKKGKIFKGSTEFNDGYYKGKKIYKQDNDVLYINDSQFTTCNHETPHYHFHSNNMKVIPNDRIIAKPVIFKIFDLPLLYLPFAVFPNKNGDRISGWIMPSFGHRSSTGTYIDNLGYYYVPNEYMDYKILLDIQDRRGLITNQNLRYKRKAGKYWYNYYLDGSFNYDNKYYLSSNDENISNLFDDNTRRFKTITWRHKQSFDPTQDLIINYKYKSNMDPDEINIRNRLDQNQLTSLSYQKRWTKNSLSVGGEKYKELFIADPTDAGQINVYKWDSGPRVSFYMPQRKLFGNGSKWYNDVYISYNLLYNDGKKTFTKKSFIDSDKDNISDDVDSCIDVDSDLICDDVDSCIDVDSDLICDDVDSCVDVDSDLICDENDSCIILNGECQDTDLQYLWSSNEDEDVVSGGAKNTIQLSMTNSLGWLTVSPRVNIYEDWVLQYKEFSNISGDFEDKSGFNRRFTWNASLSLNTKLYGIIPINIGRLNSMRHKMTPQISFNYLPDLRTSSSQIINDVDILQGTSANSLSFGSKNLRFSLDNSFQLKVKNKNQEIEKIDFLSYNLTFNYGGANNQKDRFSLIDSRVSFKKPNGQELLYLHMQHDMYDESNPDERNSFPELRKLTAQMSTHYRISGNKIGYNDFMNDDINEQNSLDSLNSSSILFLDDKKPRIGSEELWRSDLNFSIQGDYNVEEKKWDFNYFNLDTRTTLYLTKKWLLTYAVGINLMDMEMRTQSLKLFRDLHCWEFMFTWWPTGISKGFQLNINIKHPDLKDVKVRSSSSNRTFLYN